MNGARPPSLCRRLVHSLQTWPRGTFGTVDIIPDGFVFTRRTTPVRILWDEVTQIEAGTRDYLTVDLFFTAIRTARGTVWIDEMVDGFRQLEAGVFEHWPWIRERWLELHAAPPHQPQRETLWRK